MQEKFSAQCSGGRASLIAAFGSTGGCLSTTGSTRQLLARLQRHSATRPVAQELLRMTDAVRRGGSERMQPAGTGRGRGAVPRSAGSSMLARASVLSCTRGIAPRAWVPDAWPPKRRMEWTQDRAARCPGCVGCKRACCILCTIASPAARTGPSCVKKNTN